MRIWREDISAAEKLTAFHAASMASRLGIEFTEIGDDYMKARMPVDDRTRQPFGRLHGGASVALAETLASTAANLTIDTTTQVAVGLEINANHIRPASDGYVHATATRESQGRTTQVWTVRIVDDENRLICISRCTLAIVPASDA